MMTIRPSCLITMNTVTAFEQALHLMLQSNPTAPRPPGQSSGIRIFWALDGKLLGAEMHALDLADASRISRELTREWPGVSDGSDLPFFYSVNLYSVVLVSAIFNPNCFQQPIREKKAACYPSYTGNVSLGFLCWTLVPLGFWEREAVPVQMCR